MLPLGNRHRGNATSKETAPTPELRGIPTRWALACGGILLVLALGTALLLQRGEAASETKRETSRGRSLAELIAQAVTSEVTFKDSSHLVRLLESAVRSGDLEAGAVLDNAGTVVAHTDPARVGTSIDASVSTGGPQGSAAATLTRLLFGRTSPRVVISPLFGSDGTYGKAVFLLPNPSRGSLFPGLLRLFLPAGLLLLALVGFSQAMVRWASQPTLDLLKRLSINLESKEPTPSLKMVPRRESDRLIAAAVSRMNALTEARDELAFRNGLLSYEKKRMEQILENVPDGVVATDALDKVVFLNPMAGRILGVDRKDIHETDLHDVSSVFSEALRESDKTGTAVFSTSVNGGERQILLTRIPLMVSEDRSTGTLYTVRDVTAQQAAQRAQAGFLSQISHELKAPLNTILTYVEALADDGVVSQEERRQYFNTLSGEAARMAQLISNLLQLSRIQLGDLSAHSKFVKVANLVHEQSESMRAQAEARGLALDVKVPENLPALRGDKDLLGVVLTNLISNAIKYTPSGGKVAVRASATDDGVVVEVEDTGIGILEEDRTQIFERFFRSSQEEVQAQRGSGLGLSLVREIVEAHQGRVSVDSHMGKGSRFNVWLPGLESGSRLDLVSA